MAVHLLRDLEKLKKEILAVGSMVEEATEHAILALVDRRPELAREVVEADRVVDEKEIEVEIECLKTLALHHPVATDLRFVVAMLKVNNDLERVGDLAGNIAERAIALASEPSVSVPSEIVKMAEQVRAMLRAVLDAVVNVDTETARRIVREDEEVDACHARIFQLLQERMRKHPDTIPAQVQLLSVSRYLERIADMATNIAEDIVFMVDGVFIRHQGTKRSAHP